MLLGENEIRGYGFSISQEEPLFRGYVFRPAVFSYFALISKSLICLQKSENLREPCQGTTAQVDPEIMPINGQESRTPLLSFEAVSLGYIKGNCPSFHNLNQTTTEANYTANYNTP
jgi:hypothetical protein